MVAESRHLELYLPLRLVRTPLWQYQRNHAYPFFRSASFVVYICVPSVNYAAASHEGDQGLPTHHTIWLRRVDLYSYSSCFASSIHLYGDSNATMTIHCFVAHHSSSIYVCQA